MSDEQQFNEAPPKSELELQYQSLNPKWEYLNIEELEDLAGEEVLYSDGTLKLKTLYKVYGYVRRDLRLGNLSPFGGEMDYCQRYLDFAGDCLRGLTIYSPETKDHKDLKSNKLQLPLLNSFLIALSRVITVLELSQSKGGFVRRRMGTLTSEQYSQTLEPPKKGLFRKKGRGNGGESYG